MRSDSVATIAPRSVEVASLPDLGNLPSLTCLRVAYCRFTLRALEALAFPDLPGVPLAKAAGWRFRDLFCFQPDVACEACILHPCCLYTRLYGPVRAVQDAERFLPPPYVVRAVGPKKVLPDELFIFDLLLFGAAVDGLAAWIVSFDRAGEVGLRKAVQEDESAQRYRVDSVGECFPDGTRVKRYDGALREMRSYAEGVDLKTWCRTAQAMDGLRMHLRTPLQIKSGKRKCRKLDVKVIVTCAMRRLESLTGAAADDGWERFADRVWREARQAWIVRDETEWVCAQILHRSKAARKHLGHDPDSRPTVRYEGLMGSVAIAPVGSHLAWVLRAVSVVNMGGKTSQGMGWIDLATE